MNLDHPAPDGKTIAYLRASTEKQELDHQRLALLEYARGHGLKIDDFIEVQLSSRHSRKRRRLEELLTRLEGADTLMATELSRLGRSTAEVIGLVNELLQRGVRVIVTKQGLDMRPAISGGTQDMSAKIVLTLFSLFAELERDLISLRTKEALAAKKQQGVRLGKPKGTIQRSMYDKDLEQIKAWLKLGVSARKISQHLGYGTYASLNTYLNKREIREEVSVK